MKAPEMVQAIQKTEDNIHKAIAQAIQDELKALSNKTGLRINSLDIGLTDITALGDSTNNYVLESVIIYAGLPTGIYKI